MYSPDQFDLGRTLRVATAIRSQLEGPCRIALEKETSRQ